MKELPTSRHAQNIAKKNTHILEFKTKITNKKRRRLEVWQACWERKSCKER